MPDVGAQSMLGGWALARHPNGTGACFSHLIGDPIVPTWGRLSPEGWYNVGFCGMQLLSMAGLLAVILVNDRAARRGDHAATKRLILPVYHRIVYTLVLFDFFSVVLIVLRLAGKEFDCHGDDCPELGSAEYETDGMIASVKSAFIGVDWAILHWVIDGVAVFLCQTSAGQRAMRHAMLLGAVPALCSFGMGYLKHSATVHPYHSCLRTEHPTCVEGACGSPDDSCDGWTGFHCSGPGPSDLSCLWIPLLYQLCLLLVYLRVWLASGRATRMCPRVYRREAAIDYVRFWALFRMLTLLSALLVMQPYSLALVDVGFCTDFAAEAFVFTVGKALYIYQALRDDSAFWQCEPPQSRARGSSFLSAVFKRSRSGNLLPSPATGRVAGLAEERGYSLSSPLAGRVDVERADAAVINQGLEEVDQSIVISYGYLQLNKAAVLGYGGTARVYRAKLHGDDVAAKVMFCPSIEARDVKNFFKEASMLKRLEHPNIVAMHGVCCLPPTVCIVMELCAGGSLTDWLRARRRLWFPLQQQGGSSDDGPEPSGGGSKEEILPVFETEWWKPLCSLMAEAAAGVAWIHSHHLVHLDIKSMNFLVAEGRPTGGGNDQQQSRSQTSDEARESALPLAQQRNPAVVVKLADLENTAITTDFGHSFSAQEERFHTSHSEIEIPDTLDWTAPELLRDGAPAASTASDVYALAVTMWEVATLCVQPPTAPASLVPPAPVEPTEPAPEAELGEHFAMSRIGVGCAGVAGVRADAGLSVKEKLLNGWRPSFHGTKMPLQLVSLLELGWGENVVTRPSAENLQVAINAYASGKEQLAQSGFSTLG
jgi:hypothetical protein